MARIFTNRKSGFIQRGGRMRRETLWFELAATTTTLGAASTAVLFTGLDATLLAMRPFTVVRVRGMLHVASDQIAATEDYQAAIGLAVVSDQAIAIGVTAVPTPFTDIGSDLWFLHEIVLGTLRFSTASGWNDVGHLRVLDSRAMRKVEEGQDIDVSIETSAASTGVVVQKAGRLLIKLH